MQSKKTRTRATLAQSLRQIKKKPENTPILQLNKKNLTSMERNIRFFVLWGGSIFFLAITLLLGPTGAALFLLCVGGLAYLIFQEEISTWLDQHEYIIPITLAFYVLSGFNLIGLGAGLIAGYFINLQFNRAKELAQTVADSTQAIRHPITYTKSKAVGMWQSIKNAPGTAYRWLMQDEKELTPVLNQDNPPTVESSQAAPVPAQIRIQKKPTMVANRTRNSRLIRAKRQASKHLKKQIATLEAAGSEQVRENVLSTATPNMTPAFENARQMDNPVQAEPPPAKSFWRQFFLGYTI